ncbi:hypothetical protein K492DRAFT_182951 [Lichtheimia hyalospora FSU 10163]|nr:hypothetical protein K492DRAFT_182951 [Lichtheimia hyalospora FSU 10163]
MDTTSDLLQVCNETKAIVASILEGKRQLKRTVQEAMEPNDAQLPEKRSRNDYDTQPSSNDNEDESIRLTFAYDRAKFYERLETFSDAYIEHKRPLTAIQCAMHGFADTHQLEGPNNDIAKLECVNCKGTNYVIDVSRIDDHSVRLNQVLEKYTSGLYTFHRDGCFWRSNACPATMYSFPKLSTVEALDVIRKSGLEWLQSGVQLPKIIHPLNSRQSTQLDFLIRDFQNPADRYKFTITLPRDLSDAVGTSYLLPVFGWHYAEPNIIKCKDCFRKKNLHELAASESSFNVIKEHRDYCPWINCNNAHVEPPQPTPFMRQLCGYEWMLAALDLEYTLLLRIQEESPVYQASREQWFIDEQKRMQKLRETLDREFTVFSQQPESPQPQPSDEQALPAIAVTDEEGEQQPPMEKQLTPSEEPPATFEQQEATPFAETNQPPPSPGKQDDDDLGEYLESENEAEEDEKEPAAITTTVIDNKEEEVSKQQGLEEEEELDESLLEEVGDVTEPEQTEEDYKLVDATAVNEEQADKMDVDEQESTADTALHLDTLEDHDMDQVATETEPTEMGQVMETTTSSVAEKEEGEVTSVNEEATYQENISAMETTAGEQVEESKVTVPLDVSTSTENIEESIDKSEQQPASVTDIPVTTISESENLEQLKPEQAATETTEAASTGEITAMEEEVTAEEALIETPKNALQGEPESDLQTAQHDQTLSAEDELKEFAESPLPTTVEEKQDADMEQPDTITASQSEIQVPVSDNDQVKEKEPKDATLDATPQNENVQEQDDLLLEDANDDQELVQKEEAKEELQVESVQDDGISTPMEIYQVIEEDSGDVAEPAPETPAAETHIEAHAEKVANKDESIVDNKEESLANKEDEPIVENKEESIVESKEDESIVGSKEELLANEQQKPLVSEKDELIEEKQDAPLVDENELTMENEPTTGKNEEIVEQQAIVEEPSVKDNDIETPANVSETTEDTQRNVPTITVAEEQDDHSIVPVGDAESAHELHDTSTHVEEQDEKGANDTIIAHDDQQKIEQLQQDDKDVQFSDAGQAQGLQDTLGNSVEEGEKGDAMEEVEVEVHEVPDSVEDKEMKEDTDKEGTHSVEREESGVENREENREDQMET